MQRVALLFMAALTTILEVFSKQGEHGFMIHSGAYL